MNIVDLNHYNDDCTLPIRNLYEKTGNSSISGYLGEELEKMGFDEEGHLHFSTHKEIEDGNIDSHGVVLDDSVLIKQRQLSHDMNSYRLYSWDVDKSMYTFLSFDNESSLNHFFNVIKRFGYSLCDDDISLLFQEMGLTFESVTQVLLNQKKNPLDAMFDEEVKEDSPFVM